LPFRQLLPLSLPTADRRILRRTILPWFAGRTDVKRILFVGCGWYTRSYESFFCGRDYFTLDNDPGKRRWGAQRHICDSLTRVQDHFAGDSLDLVLCNGVFGWGLDDEEAAEEALLGCHACLRSGAVLMIGWNDIPARRPFVPAQLAAMRKFRPWVFQPSGTSRIEAHTRNRHVFDFYEK
jgi:hypothetical protein